MESIEIRTKSRVELVDITKDVKKIVNKSGVKNGLAVVYTKHTTTAIIVNENEGGLKRDIISTLEKIVPSNGSYAHNAIDNNADAHIRAVLLGNSAVIPVFNSKLCLGTWQSVFLVELDGPRKRTVYVTVI